MKLFLMAGVLLCGFAARADIYTQGTRSALDEHYATIGQFTQLQLEQRTQTALNNLIQATNEALKERGYETEAMAYQNEWDEAYASYFTGYEYLNLGHILIIILKYVHTNYNYKFTWCH